MPPVWAKAPPLRNAIHQSPRSLRKSLGRLQGPPAQRQTLSASPPLPNPRIFISPSIGVQNVSPHRFLRVCNGLRLFCTPGSAAGRGFPGAQALAQGSSRLNLSARPVALSGQFWRPCLSCADQREHLTGKAHIGLQTLKLSLQLRLEDA